MKVLHTIAFTLLLIGGLNWLAFGGWGWDIGQWFGGMDATASRVIYVLVGLAALWEIFSHKRNCKMCGS